MIISFDHERDRAFGCDARAAQLLFRLTWINRSTWIIQPHSPGAALSSDSVGASSSGRPRPWNAVEIGPRRDLFGDLTTAVRAKELRMGIYYSLYEWYNDIMTRVSRNSPVRFVDPSESAGLFGSS